MADYSGLIEHHLRIGDTIFYVPPTAISVHRQMKNKRTPILRARNSMPKESGYFDLVIEFTLFFPDETSINNELRPLLSQVKKCPFLPVENTYLNNTLKVEAVTISGITVQTTPGFPHTLQAQIQCYAFEHRNYITDDEDRTFDEMFNWPLFRWYYMRNLDPDHGKDYHTYFEPLYGELTNDFKFRIAAMDDLEAISAWNNKKKKLIKDYIEKQRDKFWGRERREEEFFKIYDELYDKAMFEYDIHYEDWDIPGLILTDLSIGFENTITSFQILEDAMPSHQYLGSQDSILVARFKTTNEEAIASLENLIQRTAYMIRTYHKDVANGYLEFDHALARLFGIRNVTIEDMHINTVPGHPGTFEVTLTMCAYNRIERRLNEVKWLSETVEWDIDKYQDQGFWSLFTSISPLITGAGMIGSISDEDFGWEDYFKSSPIYRIGRFFSDLPAIEQILDGLKIWAKGTNRTIANIDEEDIKNILYDEAVKAFFLTAELYPDLELPTYGEVKAAGFDIPNRNNGVFVDPDFFIDYHKGTIFYEELLESMQREYITVLRDKEGGVAYADAQNVVGVNDKGKEGMKKARGDFEAASGRNQISYEEVSEHLIDKSNLPTHEMEALIRKKAYEAGISQELPVAFAKALDPELKHFYSKGTNAQQGNIVNNLESAPVMMNKNMEFITSNDGRITGSYIGVMKVQPMYGTNINLLAKNIKYNVETGVQRMADYYLELERIYSTNAGSKIYNEENVYETFNLRFGDKEKARYAGVLMMYLGFTDEYVALIKDNKKPPTRLIALINRVLEQVDVTDEWTRQKIQAEASGLPIKDFRSVPITDVSADVATRDRLGQSNIKDIVQDDRIEKGMLHDMLRYDKRGRLVRAFPTFFLVFVDEGQYVGTVKLSDQYFQYQAVMDIMYNNSRKDASSTLYLEMSNVYGTLDDAEKAMDLANTSLGEVFKTMTMPGAVAREAERSRHRNQNYYKSIMLRTGTRIHFRMGYGSNPLEMPTVMNGTVTSIQNNGETITVIAQDDGIELTNKIRADVNETTKGGFLFSKKEPTEIVDEILTDSQGFFKNLWAGLSNQEFEKHSLGIMHFGSQGKPQGWTELGSFFGGLMPSLEGTSGFLDGAIQYVGQLLAGPVFNGIVRMRENREIAEINMNIYQTTGLTNEEHDKWWTQVKDAFGLGQADEDGININLFDKTVWDVLNICASMGDDHIVSVHPFGFRNTIFSGKPYFPLHYDYVVEGEKVIGTAVKPFRQFHAYDSVTSIIDNSIIATEENIRTVAVGVYNNEGEMDTTAPIYVDTNIWPEKQRVVNIDTTMNAKGVRLLESVPLVGGLLNKPFKWYFDEGVAIKITARGLSDYVRDMYDGYLTVVGDPSVKPYDQMWIFDTYNSIVGPADVKEVTHIMNHQMGFITMIKPDAVVVNSDRRSLTLMMALQNIAGVAVLTHALRKKLNASKYAGNLPILNAAWAAMQKGFDRMKKHFATSRVTGRLYDTFTKKAPKYQEKIKEAISQRTGTGAKASDITRWAKNGMLDKLQKLSGGTAANKLQDLLKNSRRLNIGVSELGRLKSKVTPLLTSGTKRLKGMLGGARSTAKMLWSGGHVAAGPIGWVALAIEFIVVEIICATVGEFIERWLFQRQAVLIAPLQKSGLEFTAGINGHKGSVVGDSPDFWQAVLTNQFSAFLLGFLGADTAQYQAVDLDNGFTGFSVKNTSKQVPVDIHTVARNFFNEFRSVPQGPNNLRELYDADRKAAIEQINKRLELLGKREKAKADYSDADVEAEWEKWKDKISGWFGNLWDKITSLFGGSDDGTVCILEDGTEVNGKAVNLSKYFDVIGPKIEQEAERQGLAPYAEILKAKTMQESGGNYIKYPDVMQSSESLGKPPGYIKDVDESIRQGVKYFGQVLKKANGDVKMALQAYNFGSGFIDYCKKRGVGYSEQIAYEFAEYMVKKLGRKISSIPPGYGDSKYVQRVLRYYQGELPTGACKNSGANYPTVTGAEGKKKYQTSTGKELVELGEGPWRVYMVSGGGQPKVRPGTKAALKRALEAYGLPVTVTSAWRKGDPNWHGTGWAVDLDTPNTMVWRGGKLRFPNGKIKNNARKLVKCCLDAGFRGLYFGDWDIVQEMRKEYGADAIHYDPSGHWNHLHLSYPTSKIRK